MRLDWHEFYEQTQFRRGVIGLEFLSIDQHSARAQRGAEQYDQRCGNGSGAENFLKSSMLSGSRGSSRNCFSKSSSISGVAGADPLLEHAFSRRPSAPTSFYPDR